MEYESLEKLSYKDEELCEKEYQARFHDPSAVHLNFSIHGAPAFFLIPDEAYRSMLHIYKCETSIALLRNALPGVARGHFTKRCLIDEIVLTNNIEGVSSSRKDITDVLENLQMHNQKKRFASMVQKYLLLQEPDSIHLNSCQDIRNIYDELLENEIRAADPSDLPDGIFFRQGSVSVYSSTGKEIHQGVYPESAIQDSIEQALAFLHCETPDPLINISIFHYMIGYIHPFYDGNGRLSRFLSSYLLSQHVDPLLGYRLSFTISENIKDYYGAFKTCNHLRNKGDLTPFLVFFLHVVETSAKQLETALQRRFNDLRHYEKALDALPFIQADFELSKLGFLLIQASLFSEAGISTQELLSILNISRSTLAKRLAAFEVGEFLTCHSEGKRKLYTINLEKLR